MTAKTAKEWADVTDDHESFIRAHDDDGVPCVEYSMDPDVARAVADALEQVGRPTNDTGYLEDAAALRAAADAADAL